MRQIKLVPFVLWVAISNVFSENMTAEEAWRKGQSSNETIETGSTSRISPDDTGYTAEGLDFGVELRKKYGKEVTLTGSSELETFTGNPDARLDFLMNISFVTGFVKCRVTLENLSGEKWKNLFAFFPSIYFTDISGAVFESQGRYFTDQSKARYFILTFNHERVDATPQVKWLVLPHTKKSMELYYDKVFAPDDMVSIGEVIDALVSGNPKVTVKINPANANEGIEISLKRAKMKKFTSRPHSPVDTISILPSSH